MNFGGALPHLLSKKPGRIVTADFANTQQLRTGYDVRIDGVTVGTVDKIAVAGDRRGATVTMRLNKDAGPLYADAGAAIRWKTLWVARRSSR